MCVFMVSLAFYSVCVFFFFFKQKTAYEMRISDWSSDVCSSDLPEAPAAGPAWIVIADGAVVRAEPRRDATVVDRLPRSTEVFELQREIGRASCRERVCQYV